MRAEEGRVSAGFDDQAKCSSVLWEQSSLRSTFLASVGRLGWGRGRLRGYHFLQSLTGFVMREAGCVPGEVVSSEGCCSRPPRRENRPL